MKNIVVVGGGTAGCLSALLFKNKNPEFNVTMISSSAIGILGPGEGLTPNIHEVLKALDISVETFLKETGGTIKNGIKFVNWGVEHPHWFHGFYDTIVDEKKIFNKEEKFKGLPNHTIQESAIKVGGGPQFFNNFKTAISNKDNMDNINYFAQLSYNDKIDLENKKDFAFHIDSKKFVHFLEKECSNRGIDIIDAVVTDIIGNSNQEVSKLQLDNGEVIDTDFVVDCTGFKRLIIGDYYRSEWISADSYLPATNAIACKLPLDGDTPPYTESIAMDYGWAWKIPLQHRYGCGYVYDSKYIDKHGAEKELRSLMGDSLEVVGAFSFKPGFFREIWIKNCLAIGISSVFFEPLEATAIANMINRINYFINNCFDGNKIKMDQKTIDLYNIDSVKNNESIAAFLYLHYITKKTNTDFWKNFREEHPSPTFAQIDIDLFLEKMSADLHYKEILTPPSWKLHNWMSVYIGNELHTNKVEIDNDSRVVYNRIVHEILDKVKQQQSYTEYIKNIKGE